MIPQEPVKHVTKMDVLIVHLQQNVLNVTAHHGSYFQEIVMKSAQAVLMPMMELVMNVTMNVMNVMQEKKKTVLLVRIHSSGDTNVSTHAMMENGPIPPAGLVITVMKPVKLVQVEVTTNVKLVTKLMTYG